MVCLVLNFDFVVEVAFFGLVQGMCVRVCNHLFFADYKKAY
jgi:hypothetical protein